MIFGSFIYAGSAFRQTVVRFALIAAAVAVISIVVPDVRAFQVAPRFVRSQLTWFDRAGRKLGVIGNLADYGHIELSPAADRVGVAVLSDSSRGTRSIWLVDVATGAHTVLTADAADANWMLWSSDGRRIVFNSGRNGGLDLYQAASTATSTSPGDAVLIDRDPKWPVSWSSDGRYLLYVINGQRTGNDISCCRCSDRKLLRSSRHADSENWATFSRWQVGGLQLYGRGRP
jgi:WD40 repeat protein